MKILNTINNTDFKNKTNLKEVFESTSISKYKCDVKCNFEVHKLDSTSSIIKVCGNIKLLEINDPLITKAVVYFPERKYGIEFINTDNSYNIEFLYDVIDKNEYFNLVVYDKDNIIISSMTYVFNISKIVQYPIIHENISKIEANSDIEIIDDEITFTTELKGDTNEGRGLMHIWQNLGQHMIKEPTPVEFKNGKMVTKEKLSNMCKGIWMLIAIDNSKNLIDQIVIDI